MIDFVQRLYIDSKEYKQIGKDSFKNIVIRPQGRILEENVRSFGRIQYRSVNFLLCTVNKCVIINSLSKLFIVYKIYNFYQSNRRAREEF